MNKFLTKIKKSKGYVSIETIIVAGLVIGVGVVAFIAFQGRANNITSSSLNKVDEATNQVYDKVYNTTIN